VKPIRVLLADDHTLIRAGISALLERMDGVEIVGEAADNGWTSSRTLVVGGVSLLLFVGFLTRETTHPRPLLPLRVFKSRDVSGANVVQALIVAGMFGLFFLGSLLPATSATL